MTKRVNHTHELLKDLKDSHEVLDHDSDPKVVATFYYTLRDKNGGQTHRNTSAVATYRGPVLDLIKEQFAKSIAVINNPNVETNDYTDAVSQVINGVGEFFNQFQYHSLSAQPLTNDKFEYLPGCVILWDGARLDASLDGVTMPAMYKEDGNLTLPDGAVHISQIYPDAGSGYETSVPRVVFNVTSATGAYDGFPLLNMIIEYDNDGTIFGDGSRKYLRRLRLVKGDYKELLAQEDASN